MSIFADQVLAALDRKGRSKAWLARELGIPYSNLRNYLGSKNPKVPPEVLLNLTRVLDLKMEDFEKSIPKTEASAEQLHSIKECLEKLKQYLKELSDLLSEALGL